MLVNSSVLLLDFGRNYAGIFTTRIGQMEDLPTGRRFMKMEGVDAAVAESVVEIECVVAPGLGKIAVDLYFNVPDLFVPHVFVWCTNGFQKASIDDSRRSTGLLLLSRSAVAIVTSAAKAPCTIALSPFSMPVKAYG